MAYYAGHHDEEEPPDIFIYNVPEHFLLKKLIPHLQNVAGCSVDNLKRNNGCVTANVENREGIRQLLQERVEITFATRPVRLRITSAENEIDGDEITIDVENFPNKKPVFLFLSHEKKHADKLKELLGGIGKMNISDDKICVKKTTQVEDPANWKKVCQNIINDFLGTYTSRQKNIQNCTAADSTYFASLYFKYKEKCYVRWYKDSHSIKITGEGEAVKVVFSDIEQYCQNRECERSSEQIQEFQYDDIEPAILRFVFRNKNHHSGFKAFMSSYAAAEITQDGKKLTINIRPIPSSLTTRRLVSIQQCVDSIKEYFSKFSSWKQKFDTTRVNTNRSGFENVIQPHLFVKWHLDTGMVDIVGTKEMVEERKREIMQRLDPTSREKSVRPRRKSGKERSPIK